MNIKEIKNLKSQLFQNNEDIKFLKSITNELLNSKIKNETISPLLLTHKEFIDISLSRIIKKIKQKLFLLAKQKNMPIGDKIFEIKLEYLAGYLLKYDMANEMFIHKTITKYILNIIRKNPLKLNHFVSTLNREIYAGKFGKFRYPPLYPFDKNRFNNPIPLLKTTLNKIDTINKSLKEKEYKLNEINSDLEKANIEVIHIKTAASDMKIIIDSLKEKYQNKNIELKNRLSMIKNQHSRFSVLLTELKNKIITYTKERKSLEKNINGIKEKYKDILQKEDEIIETISNNLKTMKQKII